MLIVFLLYRELETWQSDLGGYRSLLDAAAREAAAGDNNTRRTKSKDYFLSLFLAFPLPRQDNSAMALEFTTSYTKDALELFRYYKKLADRALAQCPDADLFACLDSIKHMAGNMRSRWTDFLTTDGEKPDRNRDSEFEAPPKTRAELLALWEAGWQVMFAALEPLADVDLSRTITIRSERHSVMQAINRQLAHYPYHIGQITFLAKHFAAANGQWTSLTVPRQQSSAFNQRVSSGQASQR
jgi:hypothetical protein